MKLDFEKIRRLSLHDARVMDWKLDEQNKQLTIVFGMSFGCSEEFGKQGILTIKDYHELDAIRWPDAKKGIQIEEPSKHGLSEILNEEFSDHSYQISAMGKNDWEIWTFTWKGKPKVEFVPRTFQMGDVVALDWQLVSQREFSGSEIAKRRPKNGDAGTIIRITDQERYVVECLNIIGETLWIAEFSSEELELRSIKTTEG